MPEPTTHYIRLGPSFDNGSYRRHGLRSLCGYNDRETPLKFVPRGRPASCRRCTAIEKSLMEAAERLRLRREARAIEEAEATNA